MKTENDIARTMTALSHPRRVRLFAILEAAGSKGAGFEALRRGAKLSDTTLRHHLRPMQEAGIVVRRRTGSSVTFRLHGRAARRAMEEMAERLRNLQPARLSFAQKPPLN